MCSFQLPIPSTCPGGYKLLIKQCWSSKPRNRLSFRDILMHLDIEAVEIPFFQPDDYFRTQVNNSSFSFVQIRFNHSDGLKIVA